jgi:hypothetical protein
MRRRLWLVLVVLLVLAGGAHYAYWRLVSARLAAGYSDWLAEERASGVTIAAGAPQSGGWPLSATLHVPEVFIQTPGGTLPGGIAWGADRVTFEVDLLRPRQLRIMPEGAQRLRVDGSDIPYRADRLRFELPFDPKRPAQVVNLLANNFRLGVSTGPSEPPREPVGLTIGLLQAHLERQIAPAAGEQWLVAKLAAEDVSLPREVPRAVTLALGNRISSVSIDLTVQGAPGASGDLSHRAADWRENGGSVDVPHFAIGWGKLGLAGQATLALDPALQPMGTGQLHLADYAGTLDALTASGAVPPRVALAARAMLGLLARDKNDDSGTVDLPLTLENRKLSVRGVPLAKLAPMTFP